MKIASLEEIKGQLIDLEKKMITGIERREFLFKDIHPQQQVAARNLIQYLTLRNEDIREMQDALHIYGLSSLASSESHIHRQLQSILQRLGHEYSTDELNTCDYEFSIRQIAERSKILFGEKADLAIPYIMVTFDTSFADSYALIKNLLQNGMNVARINCAHDNEAVWSRMIHHIKRACRYTGLSCKIYMDLAGPKIRTKLKMKGKKKGKVKIEEGELIWLTDYPEMFNEKEIVISPTEKGTVDMLKKGEGVYIDDGIIKGIVEIKNSYAAGVRIVRAFAEKKQIKDDKGINFPDSELAISPLTDFDKNCISFICNHADLIGCSFVRYPSDLEMLQNILHKMSSTPPPVIIKIETPQAVKNLPDLLISGMQQNIFGVMIARGDLAVEIGFERTGEIQEEILWICEAAHAPVVWATQVLETLNKSGVATRSEITDASHAAMAECVMLNKGGYIIEVIETLRNILQRTGGHHLKKRYTFRPLSIAERFMQKQS